MKRIIIGLILVGVVILASGCVGSQSYSPTPTPILTPSATVTPTPAATPTPTPMATPQPETLYSLTVAADNGGYNVKDVRNVNVHLTSRNGSYDSGKKTGNSATFTLPAGQYHVSIDSEVNLLRPIDVWPYVYCSATFTGGIVNLADNATVTFSVIPTVTTDWRDVPTPTPRLP